MQFVLHFSSKKAKIDYPSMNIYYAHKIRTHFFNPLWCCRWWESALKMEFTIFEILLQTPNSIRYIFHFHLEHPVYQTNFQAMTSLWHDESPSHFSTVNQQIVIIFSLPILIDRIFEKFLGPPFCKIHHHGPHFWKKENYSYTQSIKALVGIRFLFVLDFKWIPI